MGLLDGRKAVVFGVANERSIAWSIAKILCENGADISLAYAGEALKGRVEPLAESIGVDKGLIISCDVSSDQDIKDVFDRLGNRWADGIDIVIHSLAFADKDELRGSFVNTSRDGFRMAMDISTYSLIAVSREASPLLGQGGSILTMTYYGSEKVVPNYNVMGVAKAALEASVRYLAADLGRQNIRVNAISAGPVKTLAAMGIGGFRDMLKLVEERAPLGRNITAGDVAKAALFLSSDLASGVTGEIIYVDNGYNIKGM